MISDRKEQLLLPTTAVEVVGTRRPADARVRKCAVTIQVPVPLREAYALEVAGSVAGVHDGSLDLHVHTANVVNQRAEGWDDDDSGCIDLHAEHGAECGAQRHRWSIWEEAAVPLCSWPERVDLRLPDIAVAERHVHNVARNGDGAHPAANPIPACDDH